MGLLLSTMGQYLDSMTPIHLANSCNWASHIPCPLPSPSNIKFLPRCQDAKREARAEYALCWGPWATPSQHQGH